MTTSKIYSNSYFTFHNKKIRFLLRNESFYFAFSHPNKTFLPQSSYPLFIKNNCFFEK